MTNVIEVEKAIALGDGAVATQSLEICIRVCGFEGRTIMTEDEYKVIYNVISRMNFEETLDS